MNYTFKDHKRGDTFKGVGFTITKAGVAVNLTNASIKMQMRKLSTTGALGATYEVGTGLTITDAVNGKFNFDKQKISIPAVLYYYDIEITLSNGDVKTWIEGTWNITQDVTSPEVTT